MVAKSKASANRTAKKATPKKTASKKATPKKAAVKKPAAKKAAAKKPAARKAAPKKAVPKKAAPKKAVAKKAAPKKAAPKKAVPKKAAPRKAVPKKAAPMKAVSANKPSKQAAKAVKPARGKTAKPSGIEPPPPLQAIATDDGLGWVDAGKGYALTLDGGKLAARSDKGKRLSSVPKDLRNSDLADQLDGLRAWLAEHERECRATVERWMLRSLPIPREVLERVWDDVAWRAPLENVVVVAVTADGTRDFTRAGLFRGVDRDKGVGVVDLDGETVWLATDRIAIPHPILIDELDAWRELVTQLAVEQGISQLHRETHDKTPAQTANGASAVTEFESGKFAMLMHAIGKARQLGYKVSGGYATCKVWDAGEIHEARYWIGADGPDAEAYTGQLSWVDRRERSIKLADVGAVAFSEGMRMASAIYAARVVEKQEEAA